ncbi:DUF1737 domain-containing protein [Dyadobacter bucti]|uniref:DUF1737 domain-containing protein n=1 Tax=Dyadobacter bucti TaxID=2572203 RepID=UPI00140C8EBF
MNYIVLTAHDPSILSSNVNNLLGQGWKPLGGVSVAIIAPNQVIYAQALTR